MATLEDLRKNHFTQMTWENQLALILEIRAKRREKIPSKAMNKKVERAILALSQSEIEALRKIIQGTKEGSFWK